MILRWIETFVETAKRGSVTAASETLHITQPAVSRQLKLLQAELGAELYKRSARGIELTIQGKVFLERSGAVFRQIEELKKGLHRAQNNALVPILKLGGSDSSSISLLPKPVAEFKRKYPQVDIELRTDNDHSLSQMVIDGEIEIAVVEAVPASSRLRTELYRREQLVVFSLPKHPLARKTAVNLSDLVRYPLVIRHWENSTGTAEQLLRDLHQRGLKLHVALRCQTATGVKEAVKKKMGLGILYRSTVDADLRRGDFTLIRCPEVRIEGNSLMIYRNDSALSQWARAFLDMLRRDKQF